MYYQEENVGKKNKLLCIFPLITFKNNQINYQNRNFLSNSVQLEFMLSCHVILPMYSYYSRKDLSTTRYIFKILRCGIKDLQRPFCIEVAS